MSGEETEKLIKPETVKFPEISEKMDSCNSNTKQSRFNSVDLHKKVFEQIHPEISDKRPIRLVAVTWVRMSMGIGVMTLPYYFEQFGILTAILVLLFGGIFCQLSCSFIFRASIAKNITQYKEIVRHFLPKSIYKTIKFTFALDYFAYFVVNSVVALNIFEYFLYFSGFIKSKWIDDFKTLTFREYSNALLLIRIGFFTVVFLIIFPWLLKKSFNHLRHVSNACLVTYLTLLLFILFEMPLFYEAYKNEPNRSVEWFMKAPDLTFITNFFCLMSYFYIQPFVLSMKEELTSPTLERINKVSKLSIGSEFIFYVVFGSVCYFALGEGRVPPLMLLRHPFPGMNMVLEAVFRFLLIAFFMLNTVGVVCYNPELRKHLQNSFPLKNKKVEFYLYSLGPYVLSVVVAISCPFITKVLTFIGLVICNVNGFIIPTLIEIAHSKEDETYSYLKMIGLYLLLSFYVSGAILGLGIWVCIW